MLWLGDNTYLREADWDSKTGIYHRYSHSRSIKELQPLLAKTQHYAIWDDHDFGPNDSDRSFYNKHITLEAFNDFWCNKPNYHSTEKQEGNFSTFYWGDVQFFLLDNRFFKAPNDLKTANKDLLGENQLQWLIDAMVNSRASFKVICIGGQVVNSAAVFENYATYPEEREKLFAEIEKNKIRGVLFLSGDRHFAELSKLERPNNYPLYDWTVSALTSGSSDSWKKDDNKNRVEGSVFGENNFGTMTFSGDKNNRKVTLKLFNKEGVELWSKEITKKEIHEAKD
jgi:alkaline phosphatase D